MKEFVAFTKKDWREMVRSYKLVIIIIIFLILGFLNPIAATILPRIMGSVLPQDMIISIPEATVFDSWQQFYSNVPQMGIIVYVILLGGILEQEVSKGTLTIMLTKGLKRSTVIISKFMTAAIIWTICYSLSFLVTYLYNLVIFESADVSNLAFSILQGWLFGLLIPAALLFGGSLFKFNNSGMLVAGTLYLVMIPLNHISPAYKFNPMQLIAATKNIQLMHGTITPQYFYVQICMSIILTIAMLIGCIVSFNKKQL